MASRFHLFARTALVTFSLALATAASAQATRTWISGVGDDVNPCSRTAPCKTFAGTIAKTAAGGEINILDPGGFGTVTITKSITIDGSGGSLAGVTSIGVNGIIVNAGATGVVILRNIHLNGLSETGSPGLQGINVVTVGELHVENMTIDAYGQEGIKFAPSSDAKLFVNRSSLRNNGSGGILIAPSGNAFATAYVNHTELIGNGRGLRAEDGSRVVVANSSAVGNAANGFVGISLNDRAVDLTVENCVATDNGAIGVYAGKLTASKVAGSLITGNAGGIQAVEGGTIVSLGSNRIYGNTGLNGPPSITVSQQ